MKCCWHNVGFATHSHSGGSELMVCCNCGIQMNVFYTNLRFTQPGHGPFHTVTERVFKYPDRDCEAKDVK